ncbi:V8-like Glu-specific endopeptidase [Leptolyngbyaceae cyanobacterium JSC-12]|nr:V8-like Glu-specific endopeptidase [Leptolyngbyaceae cyanobacterium JSC-12]
MPTGTTNRVSITYRDALDADQPLSGQPMGSVMSGARAYAESDSSETVVDEVSSPSDAAETETGETGEETTAAQEADNHVSVSNPPIVTLPTKKDELDESSDAESLFESVPGWDANQRTESMGEETLIEAYYANAETSEEFFPAIAAIAAPLVKAAIPALASVVAQQGAAALSPRLRAILARLRGLGIKPTRRRETDQESNEAIDEAVLAELEQQLESLEVVIGTDDRVRVMDTKIIPFKRICHLKIQAANGRSYLGTGFFVGPRTIITAGHCVYIHGQGGWARQIMVTPGRNEKAEPFKSFTATSFRSVKGWVNSKSRNYDYGAIILPKSAAVSTEIGSFGFASYSNANLLNKKLNTAGYPGDKPAGTMWFHGRKAKSVQPRTITYDIDTAGGQSGSPVWVRGTDGKRIVVGIHTNGSPAGNSATRITQPVFNNLKRWRTEGGV